MLTTKQALQLLLQGRTQKQVAAITGVSERTIRRWKAEHVKPSFKKIDHFLEYANIERAKRVKATGINLPVPPKKVTSRVKRIVEDYSSGVLKLITKRITQTSYDVEGLDDAQVFDVLLALQKKKMLVRLFMRLHNAKRSGSNPRKSRIVSTSWMSLRGAPLSALQRIILRALQVGDAIISIMVDVDPLWRT